MLDKLKDSIQQIRICVNFDLIAAPKNQQLALYEYPQNDPKSTFVHTWRCERWNCNGRFDSWQGAQATPSRRHLVSFCSPPELRPRMLVGNNDLVHTQKSRGRADKALRRPTSGQFEPFQSQPRGNDRERGSLVESIHCGRIINSTGSTSKVILMQGRTPIGSRPMSRIDPQDVSLLF